MYVERIIPVSYHTRIPTAAPAVLVLVNHTLTSKFSVRGSLGMLVLAGFEQSRVQAWERGDPAPTPPVALAKRGTGARGLSCRLE